MKVQCEICFEWIAIIEKGFFSYPMTGAMFQSIDPHHGFPPPFPTSATWEDFRCPYGQHRPFIRQDSVLTDQGRVDLELDGSPLKIKMATVVTDDIKTKLQEVVNGTKEESQKEAEEGYTCQECGKAFKKEMNLKKHVKMAHKGKD